MRSFEAVFCSLLAFASSAQAQLVGGSADNLVEQSISHDGLTRWFLEHRPDSYAEGGALVILLHGGTQSMRKIFNRRNRGSRRWLDLSDANGFLLLAPNGVNPDTGDTKGDDQNWNDLRDEIGGNVDDVGFLTALTYWAVTERGVDPSRVYVTGASNGGIMTYTALILTPEVYAAGAAFIANLPATEVPTPDNPTPIFIMNGTKDKLMKWDGGTVGQEGGEVRSALATRDYWVQVNAADAGNVQKAKLRNRRLFDGCRITSELYPATGADSAPVQFYTMEGGGHMIPFTGFGSYPLSYRLIAGPPCRDTDGADLAWDFMSQYTL
jgi:polyhydroxybutyrate depolymerase